MLTERRVMLLALYQGCYFDETRAMVTAVHMTMAGKRAALLESLLVPALNLSKHVTGLTQEV